MDAKLQHKPKTWNYILNFWNGVGSVPVEGNSPSIGA